MSTRIWWMFRKIHPCINGPGQNILGSWKLYSCRKII